MTVGTLHYVELRTRDFEMTGASWAWLLESLGYRLDQEWPGGRSWRLGATYIVLEHTRNKPEHDRRGAGLNHLAFHAGTRSNVDMLWAAASAHGSTQLYADRWPRAGGPEHYAAFLENTERFKVELVADDVA